VGFAVASLAVAAAASRSFENGPSIPACNSLMQAPFFVIAAQGRPFTPTHQHAVRECSSWTGCLESVLYCFWVRQFKCN
jgi:hypothetical protein